MATQLETATFGAGCFWCVEAIFLNLRGVESVVSGYAGGESENPTYEQVCGGMTGHAEVIQVVFDQKEVSFEDLLFVFWRTHDPTTLNQQGADVGTQYRSAILFHTEEQKSIAEASRAETEASGLWQNPIVTEISPFQSFFPAEQYHQNYFQLNASQPYCQMVIDPKIRKFMSEFKDQVKQVV